MIEGLRSSVSKAVDQEINERLKLRHTEVAARIIAWLVNDSRKAPIKDLDAQMKSMTESIQRLAKEMTLEYRDGNIVVNAAGTAEETLRKLRLGTSWFEPMPDIIPQIMAGLYAE